MIFDNYDICNHITIWLKSYQIVYFSQTCQIINTNLKLIINNLLKKKENLENIFGKSIIEYLGGICNLLDINIYANGNYQDNKFETSKYISLGINKNKPFITFRLSNQQKLSEKYLLIIHMTNHIDNWSIINLDYNNKKITKHKPFDNFGNILTKGYCYNDNIKKNLRHLLKYRYCISKNNYSQQDKIKTFILY